MILFDHPIWRYVAPFTHIPDGRDNIDLIGMPDDLRDLALGVIANCVSCGRVIHPLRARAKSERSRIANTAVERRLFYAATCPTDVDSGCARSKAARDHKNTVRRMFGLKVVEEVAE